jgi:8-oxo-dGTP pyrophosphatase MutT (NUDIX family)
MITIGVFAGIFDDAGRELCVRHDYGKREWGMPGGRLEMGEDPISAVKREILEEANIIADITEFVGVYAATYRDDMVLMFTGTVVEALPWAPNEEISHMDFFAPADLPQPMGVNAHLRFRELMAGHRGVIRAIQEPGVVHAPLSLPVGITASFA